MISDMNHTRFFSVIIPCEEILLIIPGEKRSGPRMILPPAHIHASRVIHPVEHFRGDWPAGKLVFSVEGGELRVWREYDLIIFVRMDGHVCPAQEGVSERSPVEQPDRGLKD